MRNFLLPLLALTLPALAQSVPASDWAVHLINEFAITPNITYLTANNYEAKLDVYARRGATAPQPTLIWIHGGGWTGGAKESALPQFAPWLAMGWQVVNVEYRLARVSPAPAAVEDCLCALRWVAANAKTYNFDTSRLVTSGDSAGGHLSLTTGMIPESAGMDRECPGVALPKVAAIVNWYGITDVADLLDGPNQRNYAVQWLGSRPDRNQEATRLSPLQFVRKDLPPILTIHGDADPTVPYTHAQRLQAALEKAGVPHDFITVPGESTAVSRQRNEAKFIPGSGRFCRNTICRSRIARAYCGESVRGEGALPRSPVRQTAAEAQFANPQLRRVF